MIRGTWPCAAASGRPSRCPLGLAIAMYVIDDVAGAVFTVFGSVGLLINADFAGSAPAEARFLPRHRGGRHARPHHRLGDLAHDPDGGRRHRPRGVRARLRQPPAGSGRRGHAGRAAHLRGRGVARGHLDEPSCLPRRLVAGGHHLHGLGPGAAARATAVPTRGPPSRRAFTAVSKGVEGVWLANPPQPAETAFAEMGRRRRRPRRPLRRPAVPHHGADLTRPGPADARRHDQQRSAHPVQPRGHPGAAGRGPPS